MTEREKQQQGLEYLTVDEELISMVKHSQMLCFKYNSLSPDNSGERERLIRELIPNIGEDFAIEQPFHCDYGINLYIGKNFYANYNLTILDCARVTIGDNCFIGPNVSIYTPNHPLDVERRNALLETALPVTIGDNVWIGGSAVINPGVTIGDNCVIGSGAVVTRDIPPNSLAVGNPARVIKTINQ